MVKRLTLNWISFNVKCGSIFTKKNFTLIFFLFTRFCKTKTNCSVFKRVIWRKKILLKPKSGVFTKYLLLFERQNSTTIKTKTKRSQFEEAKWNSFFVIQFDRIFSLFYKFSSVIWGLFHQKLIPTWTWEADAFSIYEFSHANFVGESGISFLKKFVKNPIWVCLLENFENPGI